MSAKETKPADVVFNKETGTYRVDLTDEFNELIGEVAEEAGITREELIERVITSLKK